MCRNTELRRAPSPRRRTGTDWTAGAPRWNHPLGLVGASCWAWIWLLDAVSMVSTNSRKPRAVGMRPAEVCGLAIRPRSSRSAT